MDVLLHSEKEELLLDDCIDCIVLAYCDCIWICNRRIVNGCVCSTNGVVLDLESDEHIANEDKVLY
jgi:hypothetical protein